MVNAVSADRRSSDKIREWPRSSERLYHQRLRYRITFVDCARSARYYQLLLRLLRLLRLLLSYSIIFYTFSSFKLVHITFYWKPSKLEVITTKLQGNFIPAYLPIYLSLISHQTIPIVTMIWFIYICQ